MKRNAPSSSSKEIETVIKVLDDLIQIIKDTDSDHSRSWWVSDEEVIKEINNKVNRLLSHDFSHIKDLKLLFSPTSGLQELSMDNGWSSEFLAIAEKFDAAIEKLTLSL